MCFVSFFFIFFLSFCLPFFSVVVFVAAAVVVIVAAAAVVLLSERFMALQRSDQLWRKCTSFMFNQLADQIQVCARIVFKWS